jgi:hypothetical protein
LECNPLCFVTSIHSIATSPGPCFSQGIAAQEIEGWQLGISRQIGETNVRDPQAVDDRMIEINNKLVL